MAAVRLQLVTAANYYYFRFLFNWTILLETTPGDDGHPEGIRKKKL